MRAGYGNRRDLETGEPRSAGRASGPRRARLSPRTTCGSPAAPPRAPRLSRPLDECPDELRELVEPRRLLPLEVQAHDAPPGLGQRLEIAEGLGGLERREAVARPGDGRVLRVIARDLQEDPRGRPTLVQLS